MKHPAPRRIDILAFANVQLLDVAGPLQAFASANELACAHGFAPPYSPRVVAADGGGTVTTSAGLGIVAEPLPDDAEPSDTLVVAGGWGVYDAARDPALVAWVRAQAASARRVASVCTGAFLLAAAGLLDERRAVTHWTRCAELGRRYPAVRVEPDPIFIRDGDVWTSAGVTAGIDLTLALIEDDLGRALALAIARHLVVFLKRPGGQAQFGAGAGVGKRPAIASANCMRGSRRTCRRTCRWRARGARRHERAQLRAPLSVADRRDARALDRTVAARSGTAAARRYRAAGEAHRSTLRLWLGGNDAARILAGGRRDAAGVPGTVRLRECMKTLIFCFHPAGELFFRHNGLSLHCSRRPQASTAVAVSTNRPIR